MKSNWIKWAIVPLFALIFSACSAILPAADTSQPGSGANFEPEDSSGTSTDQGESVTPTKEEATPHSNQNPETCEDPFADGPVPAFRTDGWATNFCLHSIPYDEIFPGGPPRDGIPPLDDPQFESVDSADQWIEDPEPVILLNLGDDVRAYPLQILIWHEIVNDQLADTPVAVTFCPLCNTALVFARPEINGEILTFGTSGNLRNSDLVMWDRQTESWWQQFSGEAIVGDLTGTKLEFLPSAIISWQDFKSKYPDGEVLSINTGFSRNYGRNPYPGYDNVNSLPFLFTGNLDEQLPAMARVVGILLDDGTGGAFSLDLLRENKVVNEMIAGDPIAIFWKSGTASAVDDRNIADGQDVGTTGVFRSEIDGEVLTFSPTDQGLYTDQETGSVWDITGEAVSGPLTGKVLVPLPHHDTFWFAWAAFVPNSSLAE